MLALVLAALMAYLIGAIPFGYLAGRVNGIDIREHGSGNIGATNVLRTLGKPWGYSVFAGDALKGLLAVRLGYLLAVPRGLDPHLFAVVAAACCVAGHSFPLWLKFRGGKGVATSAGALVGIVPVATVVSVVIWALVFALSRYVSLASILATISLPIAVLLIRGEEGRLIFYFTLAMAVLVVWRHRSNLGRLLRGTEPRSTRK